MSGVFVSSLSGASARQAVVEETSASVWLYMTAPNGDPPVAACFLYNTGRESSANAEEPPPLESEYASDYRVRLPVTDDDVEIRWSAAGDAVAVRIHGEFVAFIASHDLLGYSRTVREDCAWAHAFDVEMFRRLFGAA
jgi:hypothetical protein